MVLSNRNCERKSVRETKGSMCIYECAFKHQCDHSLLYSFSHLTSVYEHQWWCEHLCIGE